ncbi:MAG: hypothetical protein RMX35_03010 [Nostoc sp. DcaGUA01]|nr:hypothetical protein [Nostoc sp. DcaGUA01]
MSLFFVIGHGLWDIGHWVCGVSKTNDQWLMTNDQGQMTNDI